MPGKATVFVQTHQKLFLAHITTATKKHQYPLCIVKFGSPSKKMSHLLNKSEECLQGLRLSCFVLHRHDMSRHAAEAWPNGLENRVQGQDHQHGSHSALQGVHGDPDTTRHGPGKKSGDHQRSLCDFIGFDVDMLQTGEITSKIGKVGHDQSFKVSYNTQIIQFAKKNMDKSRRSRAYLIKKKIQTNPHNSTGWTVESVANMWVARMSMGMSSNKK